MARLTMVILLTLLAGMLTFSGCVEREEMSTESAGRDGAETHVATEGQSPTPEPAPTTAPEVEEAEELDIPRYEFSSGNREIYVIDADGENEQRLTDDQDQHNYPVWSPDGSQIASITFDMNQLGQRIFVMDADGSNRREITSDAGHGPISWSPDGSTIALNVAHGNHDLDGNEIHLIDADGSNLRQLTNQASIDVEERYANADSPTWSPDGDRIAFVAPLGFPDSRGFARVELYVVDVAGDGVARQLTDVPDLQKSAPDWSRDGRSIVFAATSIEDNESAIYVVDADGQNLRRLTEGPGQVGEPAWSPDGERIAFVRDLFGSEDIYVMDADGSNVEQLTDEDTSNESPAWSPDGDRIAFVASRDARLAEPCSYGEEADLAPTEPFENLAWTSHQAVVGTITAKEDPAWAEPDVLDHGGGVGDCLQIMTDYIVEVEQRYRGEPAQTLRVRARGGQIGVYEQDIGTSPEFDEGDRVLLFLTEAPKSELLPDAYRATGQHSWDVTLDDRVHGNTQLDSFDVIELQEVADRVRSSLAGDPPDGVGARVVPPDEAPVHD